MKLIFKGKKICITRQTGPDLDLSNYYIIRVTLNTEFDTLCLSRPYSQLTQFGGSDFGVSF